MYFKLKYPKPSLKKINLPNDSIQISAHKASLYFTEKNILCPTQRSSSSKFILENIKNIKKLESIFKKTTNESNLEQKVSQIILPCILPEFKRKLKIKREKKKNFFSISENLKNQSCFYEEESFEEKERDHLLRDILEGERNDISKKKLTNRKEAYGSFFQIKKRENKHTLF